MSDRPCDTEEPSPTVRHLHCDLRQRIERFQADKPDSRGRLLKLAADLERLLPNIKGFETYGFYPRGFTQKVGGAIAISRATGEKANG